MPGYSGTPLPKKLGLKENLRVAFVGLPPEVKAELQEALASCVIVKDARGALDFAMVFAKKQADVKAEFSRLGQRLSPSGMLWVSWPKKASGVATDMNENDVRRIGLEAGLVDVKVCAVTEVWSGLKFVRRLNDRPRG
jgi:hypothetical protein